MDLNRKYEFLQPLADPTVSVEQTVPVQERTSGRILLLHLFPAGRGAEDEPLLKQAGQLPSEQQCHIVEIGEWQGAVFIVTSLLPGAVLFRTWLGASAGVAPGEHEIAPAQPVTAQPAASLPAPQPPDTPPAPAGPPTGDLNKAGQWAMPALGSPSGKTRIQIPQWDAGEFKAAQQNPPAPAVPDTPTAPDAATPGEFTRLLRMSQAEAPPPQPGIAPPPLPAAPELPPFVPEAAPPPSGSEPGEFTRLLHASQFVPPAAAASEPVLPVPPPLPPPVAAPPVPTMAPRPQNRVSSRA